MPKGMRHLYPLLGAALAVSLTLAIARGEEPAASQEDLRDTVQKLQKKLKEQEQRLADLEGKENIDKRIQREDIKEVVAEMMKDSEKRDNMPPWMENLTLMGDFRLRYAYNGYNWGPNDKEIDENKDRNRARFRLRFGLVKTWLDNQVKSDSGWPAARTPDPIPPTRPSRATSTRSPSGSIWPTRSSRPRTCRSSRSPAAR